MAFQDCMADSQRVFFRGQFNLPALTANLGCLPDESRFPVHQSVDGLVARCILNGLAGALFCSYFSSQFRCSELLYKTSKRKQPLCAM